PDARHSRDPLVEGVQARAGPEGDLRCHRRAEYESPAWTSDPYRRHWSHVDGCEPQGGPFLSGEPQKRGPGVFTRASRGRETGPGDRPDISAERDPRRARLYRGGTRSREGRDHGMSRCKSMLVSAPDPLAY